MAQTIYTFYLTEGVLYRYAWGAGEGGVWRDQRGVWEFGITMMGYAHELSEDAVTREFGLTHEQLYAPLAEA